MKKDKLNIIDTFGAFIFPITIIITTIVLVILKLIPLTVIHKASWWIITMPVWMFFIILSILAVMSLFINKSKDK